MNKILSIILFFVIAISVFITNDANAFIVLLEDFEGKPYYAQAEILGDNTTDITFNLSLVNTIGDIRGFFFDYTGVLSNVSITGDNVTEWTLNEYLSSVGNGSNNINGIGITFDGGVEIGSQGIGKDDICATSFTLHNDNSLSLGDTFAMRLMSVGTNRNDSSKLVGTYSIPEPISLILLGLGLLAFLKIKK